ncbi:hypothetical protein DTO021C3_8102 [Paecilomyces variotii]|nr:hypothetical protein DTO021C3_8102 [Paecilomyces variotii]KAJ9306292.1 hypothetical protein DTO217A2_4226 [Paecilomyces variotii]KAJ9351657.1 hypothetical protein DTO027B9_6244 [Paecilomyces variotii]KAJ9410584.1 hypothetical protein DTO045G8_1490 [Paecilomyces variotii]
MFREEQVEPAKPSCLHNLLPYAGARFGNLAGFLVSRALRLSVYAPHILWLADIYTTFQFFIRGSSPPNRARDYNYNTLLDYSGVVKNSLVWSMSFNYHLCALRLSTWVLN